MERITHDIFTQNGCCRLSNLLCLRCARCLCCYDFGRFFSLSLDGNASHTFPSNFISSLCSMCFSFLNRLNNEIDWQWWTKKKRATSNDPSGIARYRRARFDRPQIQYWTTATKWNQKSIDKIMCFFLSYSIATDARVVLTEKNIYNLFEVLLACRNNIVMPLIVVLPHHFGTAQISPIMD